MQSEMMSNAHFSDHNMSESESEKGSMGGDSTPK